MSPTFFQAELNFPRLTTYFVRAVSCASFFTPLYSGGRRSATARTVTRSKRRFRAKTKNKSILDLPRRRSRPATLRCAAFFPVSTGICFCLAAAQVKDKNSLPGGTGD